MQTHPIKHLKLMMFPEVCSISVVSNATQGRLFLPHSEVLRGLRFVTELLLLLDASISQEVRWQLNGEDRAGKKFHKLTRGKGGIFFAVLCLVTNHFRKYKIRSSTAKMFFCGGSMAVFIFFILAKLCYA